MNKFVFNPPNGLLDKNIYPANPGTEEAARGQVQEPMNQIKDFINKEVVEPFSDFKHLENGYQVLPGGLILQWGMAELYLNNENSKKLKINYPKQFNKALNVTGSVQDNNITAFAGYTCACSDINDDSFVMNVAHYNLAVSNGRVRTRWFAIGI